MKRQEWKEGRTGGCVLFNDALNMLYLWLHGMEKNKVKKECYLIRQDNIQGREDVVYLFNTFYLWLYGTEKKQG